MNLHSTDTELIYETTGYIVFVSALIDSCRLGVYKGMNSDALEGGITPTVVKEITYQTNTYLGYLRSLNAISYINKVVAE